MAVRNRKQAVQAALKTTRNTPGMCQQQTRLWFGAPSVGDYDRDGSPDAEDGWKSEPVAARHIDRQPPAGTPVAWDGGSRDNGHRAVSLGPVGPRRAYMIRTTDGGGAGVTATMPLSFPEDEWGMTYLGWSDTISGLPIPLPEIARQIRAATINIPRKVGRSAWRQCFVRTAERSDIFGINESFHRDQRDLFASLAERRGLAYSGLRKCGNPVFWNSEDFVKNWSRVYSLHGRGTSDLARRYPGFNAGRTINEVVLTRVWDGQQVAVLNTHLVPDGKKVDPAWRRKVRRESKQRLRRMAARHRDKGRVVIVMGDMNIKRPFWLGKGLTWIRGAGITKIGSNKPGEFNTYPAPTDHKQGILATIRT